MTSSVSVQNSLWERLETPNLFASYRIDDYPRAGLSCYPWEMTNTQAILLNAYDFLGNRRTRKAASKILRSKEKLHSHVKFDGPVMLDSGAFNFLKHEEISINPRDVLSVGIDLEADVSVVLDHPLHPKSGRKEQRKRWSNTIANTRSMFETLKEWDGDIPRNFQLMPVMHGYNAETLKYSLDDIVKIWGQEPALIGIGSLAPLALNGSKRTVIDIIVSARQLLPNSHIHCFSLGSALLMLFAFYCGADTVDSQTWIVSAAFKNAQLPGFHSTRFSSREAQKDPGKYEQTRQAFAQQLLQLVTNEGFAVKYWDANEEWPINSERDAFSYLDYLEDRDGNKRIHGRACHNLYTFNFEASRVREEKKSCNLETFIRSRMKSTVYQRTFDYAIDQTVSRL
ncbi:MAG: hypothetical protein OXL39_09465 [Caldilineaceae bacterium]|nr:hypothetical protein [Caldilineaceae bacterium]